MSRAVCWGVNGPLLWGSSSWGRWGKSDGRRVGWEVKRGSRLEGVRMSVRETSSSVFGGEFQGVVRLC